MLGDNKFENFIVKQITHPISFDIDSLELQFNKIVASEGVMNKIYEEGVRYGYNQISIDEIVVRTLRKISNGPNTEEIYRELSTDNIVLGQHLKIITHDDNVGRICIELCCIEKGHYLVLFSDDKTLVAGDKLISIMKCWNICESIDFMIYRNDCRYPNVNTIFRTSKVVFFEMYNPSAVYQIYDSEKEFVYEESECIEKAIVYYASYPNHKNPVAFTSSDFCNDKSLPYKIIVRGNIASLLLNESWFDSKSHILDFILSVRSLENRECEFINDVDIDRELERFIQVQAGVLKRAYTISSGDIWMVEKCLKIKNVYKDGVG